MTVEKMLTVAVGQKDGHTLAHYVKRGGYTALKKALTMDSKSIIGEVKASGLRGRGGAGFPCGLKWSFVPVDSPKAKYVVCNADEGEPGTFKDIVIMENDPHMLLEGIAIACLTINAEAGYIYIRGEFVRGAMVLEAAIEEARKEGFLGKDVLGSGRRVEIYVHRGAGAYICGEETGLLESLAGRRGHPRLKPPFPAVIGAFDSPTILNNVETLACIPHIINNGGEWFSEIGINPKNSGTKLFAVSGHVEKPGVYELSMGFNLKELIFDVCGGVPNGRSIKAVIPGGSSAPPLTAAEIDVPLDFDTLMEMGTMLGSGAVIVVDDTTCMVKLTKRITRFYAHESCGQCSPCREGTHWLDQIVDRIERGEGKDEDLDLIIDICQGMMGTTICVLSDACAMPVKAFVEKYRPEFEEHIRLGRCPMGGDRD